MPLILVPADVSPPGTPRGPRICARRNDSFMTSPGSGLLRAVLVGMLREGER